LPFLLFSSVAMKKEGVSPAGGRAVSFSEDSLSRGSSRAQ